MQPYFLPYIGYFQLISAVDLFIVHDSVKYTKKGWINRNRILVNGADAIISVPLKHASDVLNICERELAMDFEPDKILNRIAGAYRKAPFFAGTFHLAEQIVRYEDRNLFRYLVHSITKISEALGIETRIATASTFGIDPSLRHQEKVIALCKAAGAAVYVNAIGGVKLYSDEAFRSAGLELRFIDSKPFDYRQFDAPFVPSLSIIDVMMFNPPDQVRRTVGSNYSLITAV